MIGLFTRLAALGMTGFVAVMSLVDITGHGVDVATIGVWFDEASGSLMLDQRLFWVVILLTLVLKGAGPISADRLLGLKERTRAGAWSRKGGPAPGPPKYFHKGETG